MLYYEYKFTWVSKTQSKRSVRLYNGFLVLCSNFYFFLCGRSLTACSDVNVVFFFVVVSGSFASGLH